MTLTGVGGVGKTRLALEVASRLEEQFDDGAVFCELAPLEDGAAVTHAVAGDAEAAATTGTGHRSHGDRVSADAHDCCCWSTTASTSLTLPRGWSTRSFGIVRMLSCWRRAEKRSGWKASGFLPVSPLPVDDATELFAERARAGRPDFDLDHEPVGAVAEICRRLDGLPLAIELAAARMRVMSSLDVARRLDRLRLLSGGARDASPRQQSLAATIDWSYRLLTEAEQALFMRLSVFAGGFDLEAAHGVCGADGDTEDDTLDLLTGLLDKSMVKMRIGTDRSRYFVLETLRAYGRDRLREKGIGEECASRHAEYYAELAELAASGHARCRRGRMGRADAPRLRQPARRVRARHRRRDMDIALRLVTSLSEFVHLRIGYESSGLGGAGGRAGRSRAPAVCRRRRVRGARRMEQGEFDRARSLAALAGGRPRRGQRPRRLPRRRTRGLGAVRG